MWIRAARLIRALCRCFATVLGICTIEVDVMDETTREIVKMSFEFANQVTQQLITLSTAILALTITFTKEIVKHLPSSPRLVLKAAWLIFLLSICAGLWTMTSLTSALALYNSGQSLSIMRWDVRFPHYLQFFSFIIGILLIIIYGLTSLRKQTERTQNIKTSRD